MNPMTAPDSVLLPCPSCGGAAELRREHGRDVSLTWIECSACPIRTTSRGWLGSDEAIVDALAYAWNNRPALARGPQQAGGEDGVRRFRQLTKSDGAGQLLHGGFVESVADGPWVLYEDVRALQAEVARARNELSCCDDVPLQDGLAAGIANLREQRDALQAEVARLRESLSGSRNVLDLLRSVVSAEGVSKFTHVESRSGSLVCVQSTINAIDAALNGGQDDD